MTSGQIIFIVVLFCVCLAVGWVAGVKIKGRQIRDAHKNDNKKLEKKEDEK